MKSGESATDDGMPNVLRQDIESERVVIFSSKITDIRPISAHLRQFKIPYRVIRMGTQSQAMQDRLAQLECATGWHQLPQVFIDGRFIGGYDEFFVYDFGAQESKVHRRIPTPALALGVSGLIPFLFGAAALWLAPYEWRADTLRLLFVYSAIILTFIGAIHWGLAMRPAASENAQLWQRLGLSVVPALIAWISFSQSPITAFSILIGAYLAQYVFDVIAVRIGWAPPWHLRLRFGLTVVVTVCLLASLLALSVQQGFIASIPDANTSGAFVQDRGGSARVLIGMLLS